MKLTPVTAALLAVGLAGCSTFGGGPASAPTTGGVPAAAAAAIHTTPVVFTQPTAKLAIAPITIKLPERRGLGTYTRNVDCWVYVRPIRDTDFPPGAKLTVEERAALTKSKVDVVPGEKADVAAAQGADYLLTGNVPIAHADLCINDFFNADPADVDAQVTVSWQLWSVREGRVVYETTTTGTGSAKSPEQVITPAVLVAMQDATQALLQSAAMQQYLTFGHPNLPALPPGIAPAPAGVAPAAAVPMAPAVAPVALPGIAPAPALPALAVQPILVTLSSAGGDLKAGTIMLGKGAGFYVGTEGYAITSAAAVGGATTVGVTDGTGQSQTAQVVRRADAAGLALLKLPNPPTAPLALLPHRLAAGDKVMSPSGSGTVSGAPGADGTVPAKLGGTAPGAPVTDSAGNVVGVAVGNGAYLPIAAAFRALSLGVTLSER